MHPLSPPLPNTLVLSHLETFHVCERVVCLQSSSNLAMCVGKESIPMNGGILTPLQNSHAGRLFKILVRNVLNMLLCGRAISFCDGCCTQYFLSHSRVKIFVK